MFLEKCLHNLGSMGTGAIPDQDKGTLDVTHKMLQSNQQFFRIDRTFKMPFVDLARDRQACHARYFSAKTRDPFQLWCLPFWRPGETDWLCIGKPKFIFKHDLCAEPPSFFLSGANLDSARRGSTPRLAPSLLGPLFAHSSPDHSITG